MRLVHIDRSMASAVGLLCVAVIFAGWGMRGDAGVIPLIVAGLGLIASIWLGFKTWLSDDVYTESDQPKPDIKRMTIWSISLLMLLILLQSLGTYIVLPLFLIFNIKLLAGLRWVTSLAVALGFTLAIYIVFSILLDVPLPPGQLLSTLYG